MRIVGRPVGLIVAQSLRFGEAVAAAMAPTAPSRRCAAGGVQARPASVAGRRAAPGRGVGRWAREISWMYSATTAAETSWGLGRWVGRRAAAGGRRALWVAVRLGLSLVMRPSFRGPGRASRVPQLRAAR